MAIDIFCLQLTQLWYVSDCTVDFVYTICTVLSSLKPYSDKMSLGNDHLTFKGGYGFFLRKYSDSQCCWKKYSDFGGGKKKKSDSKFLWYNLRLNSGKKICTLRDKKINIYSNSRVIRKKNSEQNKKP